MVSEAKWEIQTKLKLFTCYAVKHNFFSRLQCNHELEKGEYNHTSFESYQVTHPH